MDYIVFETKKDFRQWLDQNTFHEGVWLLFGKKGGPKTLSADEALREALCYGWIDGQMQKLDEKSYVKYFAPRRPKSNWSAKNKKLIEELTHNGQMTEAGLKKIQEAKKDGSWEVSRYNPTTSDMILAFTEILIPYPEAFKNFNNMSPSVQKAYTGYYFDAKSDDAKARRLLKIVDRLEKNLKPM